MPPLPAKPLFRVFIVGFGDITDTVRDRLIDLTVTDESGQQADTAEIRLDDRESRITLPRKGAEMEISFGWDREDLTRIGRYTADEFELNGPPDTLVIRAKGADMHSDLKAQKTRSWDDVSIGDLVAGIAADHDLEPRVGSSLRGIRIPHLDQTDESDMHLLTRLAREHDAVAKPASGRLFFVPRGRAASASGKPMPSVTVHRRDVRDWRVTLADRGEYKAVRAHWRETEAALRKTEQAGSGSPVYTLSKLYASATEAVEAARSKLASLTRGTGNLTLSLSRGNPVVAAESQLTLRGFREGVDGPWVCTRVRHVLSGRGGYTTGVEGAPRGA